MCTTARRPLVKTLLLTLAVMVSACSNKQAEHYTEYHSTDTSIPDSAVFALIIQADNNNIPFLGYANFDDVGLDSGSVLYPANNAATFLAAIITHLATVESIKTRKENALQEQANKIKDNYQKEIDAFTVEYVMAGIGIASKSNEAIPDNQAAKPDFVIKSEPVYFISNDNRSFMLKNLITIYPEHAPDDFIYRNMIEVISTPTNHDMPKTHWQSNNGQAFILTNLELFQRSVLILMEQLENNPDVNNTEKTFRYIFNGKKNYERAELISSQCNYLTIKTLRGWIKSIPRISPEICQEDKTEFPEEIQFTLTAF